MSQENLEVVKRAIAAINDHDIDSYLPYCTADVQLETPITPIEGVYEGADGVRRYFADILEHFPDFRVTIERLEPIEADRILGFLRLNMSGRASGITLGGDIPSANIWDFTDGKIKRVRIFFDRREALEAAGLSQENLETVKRAVAAVNARDIDRYLDCCTEDIELHFVAMATVGGVYIGRDAIQRFWTDMADTTPDFRLEIERLEQTAADQVLAYTRASATGRASGLSVADHSPGTNVYDFAGGKIRRVRIFRDRHEALEAVGLSEQG